MGENETQDSEELSFDEERKNSANQPSDEQKPKGGERKKISIEALKLEFENSVAEIDRQLKTLSNLERRSRRLGQVTLVFIGLLATGISLTDPSTLTSQMTSGSNCAVANRSNCVTTFQLGAVTLYGSLGGLFFLLVFSGPETYAENRRTTANDLDSLLNDNRSEREYLKGKIRDYQKRIENNRSIIKVKSGVINLAIFLVSLSVGSLTLLIHSTVTQNPVPIKILLYFTAFLSIVLAAMAYFAPNGYLHESFPVSMTKAVYKKCKIWE